MRLVARSPAPDRGAARYLGMSELQPVHPAREPGGYYRAALPLE